MKNAIKIISAVILVLALASCKKTDYSISITTDIKESSVVITKNTPVSIVYSITSPTGVLSFTVESSPNIRTKHIPEDDFNGVVTASLIEAGTDSYVRIIADNGTNKAEFLLNFEMENIIGDGSSEVSVSPAGGDVPLQIKSNVAYEVVIPEEAQSWIQVAEQSKTMTPYTVMLNVTANEDVDRSATVVVRSKTAAEIKASFHIAQEGILNNLKLTCGKAGILAPMLLGDNPSGMIFWGDGYFTEWIPGATHSYIDGVKDHFVEIHTLATGFEIPAITGISKIDLTDF